MGLISKIKALFQKNDVKLLPEGDSTEKNMNQEREDFLNKNKVNGFEGYSLENLSREQRYEKILRLATIDPQIINNPRSRELLFSVIDDVDAQLLEKYNDDVLNRFRTDGKFALERIIPELSDGKGYKVSMFALEKEILYSPDNPWKDGIRIEDSCLHDGKFEKMQYLGKENKTHCLIKPDINGICIIETKSYNNPSSGIHDITDYTHIYDKNGVEQNLKFQTQRNGVVSDYTYSIERKDVGIARITYENEQTHCDLDLTKRKADFSGFVPDLADLDIKIYRERGHYTGKDAEAVITEDKTEEPSRKEKIKELIRTSRFSSGLTKMLEEKNEFNR